MDDRRTYSTACPARVDKLALRRFIITMLEAWYMDDDPTVDQREEHRLNPNKPASLEVLQKLGVLYWAFDADTYKENPNFAVSGGKGGEGRGRKGICGVWLHLRARVVVTIGNEGERLMYGVERV